MFAQEKLQSPGPLKRVLVPLDGTLLSERIFSILRSLLARQETELVLLAVVPRDGAWSDGDESIEATSDYLDWRRQLLARHPGRVRYAIRVGEPAAEIVRYAEEIEPTFIAMATHGRPGWRHGSVTEEVLRRSPFPVLAANPAGLDAVEPARSLDLHEIVVALDGSLRAGKVLPLVVELARLHDSVVTLVHVVEKPASKDELLESWRVAAAASGARVRALTLAGPPVESILAVARAHDADLVALTTHGRGGRARLVYGSVAEELLRRCPCPVLLQRTVEAPKLEEVELEGRPT